MLHKIDAEIGVKEPPGHNITANNDPGFCSQIFMKKIHKRGGLFSFNPSSERNYDKFPDFQRNILSGLDFNQLNKWLNSHKKDMSCLQKWGLGRWNELFELQMDPWFRRKKWEREQPILKHVYFRDRLKAHVHPNSIARLCFCFEMHLPSNAVFWLIGFHFWGALHYDAKNDCEGDHLFSHLAEA